MGWVAGSIFYDRLLFFLLVKKSEVNIYLVNRLIVETMIDVVIKHQQREKPNNNNSSCKTQFGK